MKRGLLLLLLFWLGPARADDHPDLDPGAVAPVAELLQRVEARHPGARVLKVELEREEEGEPMIYEVKVLTPEGVVVKLEFRASDLTLLKEQRPPPRHREH